MSNHLTLHHTEAEIAEVLEKLQDASSISMEKKLVLIEAIQSIQTNRIDRFISLVQSEIS